MMKLVRVDVIAATKEKQVPWGHFDSIDPERTCGIRI
jgi:hypothetical protein